MSVAAFPLWLLVTIALVAGGLVLALLWIAVRIAGLSRPSPEAVELRIKVDALSAANERLERELRSELALGRQEGAAQALASRREIAGAVGQFAQGVQTQVLGISSMQKAQLDGFAQQLAVLTDKNDQRLEAVRVTVEHKLESLRADNAARLEVMRATVDEKLQATLELRLGQSFRLVSERLEQVQRGLGEMQTLATGVGDLKRVLTNVKTRGVWGEMQLEALLEQVLIRGQYDKNVATRPGSQERVEFAIRLPGRGATATGDDGEVPVWLPIDAKFPIEDYARLQEAQDHADAAAVESAAKALETRLRAEAQKIREKYISPPSTTDFAVLYLPVEGLYAEVLRRPGLAEQLQREHHVVLSGPTTLAAMLNSLQMGFRTLAIERRSAEVWHILAEVKTEFGKFAEVLARTQGKLAAASNELGQAEVRTRAIERKLRGVEALPGQVASPLPQPLPAEPPQGH